MTPNAKIKFTVAPDLIRGPASFVREKAEEAGSRLRAGMTMPVAGDVFDA